MFILGSQITGLDVISLQSGEVVARMAGPITSPDNLGVMAFFVCSGALKQQQSVLLIRDIRQLAKNAVLIDSAEEIEDANEIVRLKDILQRGFKLLGITVVNESGVRLGKVEDYTIDINNYKIQKLYLKQSLMRSFLLNSLIVDRTQIIDVSPKQITVRDAVVKDRIKVPAVPIVPAPGSDTV